MAYFFWYLMVVTLVKWCANASPGRLSNLNLTIAGEYWDPFLVIEENPDGSETYRLVK